MVPNFPQVLTRPGNRMDRKTNIDSIRDLEERIKEHERAIIKLKRVRNSLLNVSKLPPELLGEIFKWNINASPSRVNLAGWIGDLTTSSSFATIGSRSPHTLRKFGVTGATP